MLRRRHVVLHPHRSRSRSRHRPPRRRGAALQHPPVACGAAAAAATGGRICGPRFDRRLATALHRERAGDLGAAKLARAGLSAPKIRTLKAIAKAIDRGELDLPALTNKPADEAHAALTAVHGIGPWTADIYLLFCLGHADAWPAGDLALQEAMRLMLTLKTRPSAKEMGPLAESWRPWRGAAACMLWTYYRAAKQRDGAPISATMSNA
jgi:DNA-3-methyladenine glycosylase II